VRNVISHHVTPSLKFLFLRCFCQILAASHKEVVLQPQPCGRQWGDQWSQKEAGHRKIFVGHTCMFKYEAFNIKSTYNHEICIPDVQLHSTKISLGGSFGDSGASSRLLTGVPWPSMTSIRTAPDHMVKAALQILCGILLLLFFLYPPSERSEWGIYCDALIPSFRPSVRPSIRPSVHTQYLDANILKTVWVRDLYQLTTNGKRPMADRMMTSSMTSRDPERSRSWPQYI